MASPSEPHAAPRKTRQTRIVRRRRRARDDDIESDGEPVIERSDTESDVSDPTDSEDDEDEDENAVDTTAGTKGPPVVPDPATPPTDNASATTLEHTTGPSSKETSQLWSDEVAAAPEIATDGDGTQLPVIDFAELSVADNVDDLLATKGSSSSAKDSASAKPLQSKEKHVPAHVAARQTYLKKLADPSFTPRVGQFWGHDDRLMDKGERPMSDWWRGRWATRGGRGGGRGRGGARIAPWAPAGMDVVPDKDADPINDRWGHDGYEEQSKQRERAGGPSAGPGRARGGFKDGNRRGSRKGSPAQMNPTEKQAQLQAQAAAKIALKQKELASGEIESTNAVATSSAPSDSVPPSSPSAAKAKKKEKKPKSRIGEVLSRAAKERETAGAKSIVAQLKEESKAAARPTPGDSPPAQTAVASEKKASPAPPKVNLPFAKKQGKAVPPHQTIVSQDSPAPAPAKDLVASILSPSAAGPSSDPLTMGSQSNGALRHQRRTSDKDRSEAMERAILKTSFTKIPGSSASTETNTTAPAVTSNLAPSVPTPPYQSYSYVSLPPGIAMGESGMLYEIATNRPVVLNQPTPPLQPPAVPLYHPRPYLPPHLMSTGSGFATPTPEASNPAQNFFAPPKATGRVSIRQPGSKEEGSQPSQAAPPPTGSMNASAPVYRPHETQYYNGTAPYYPGTSNPNPPSAYEEPYYPTQYYPHPGYGYPNTMEYSAPYSDGNPYANYEQPAPPPGPHPQQYAPPQGTYY